MYTVSEIRDLINLGFTPEQITRMTEGRADDAPVNDGKAKSEKKAEKKSETKLRLTDSESADLMNEAWKNRAAAAYDRRMGGTGAVRYKDLKDPSVITADDIAKGKESLLKSKKWASAVKNHGVTEADLEW